MKIIDISTPISQNTPTWPEISKPRISLISSIKEGGSADDTKIEMSLHTGTHVEAPSHFILGGKSVDKIDLNRFIGSVFVAYLPEVKKITKEDVERLEIPEGVTRLLFKTSNSLLWEKGIASFTESYVGLTTEASKKIVERGITLVGIDYISIANFSEAMKVHQILLKEEVVILEGLNLTNVDSGVYELIAVPIMIPGVEAAPVRAVLIK